MNESCWTIRFHPKGINFPFSTDRMRQRKRNLRTKLAWCSLCHWIGSTEQQLECSRSPCIVNVFGLADSPLTRDHTTLDNLVFFFLGTSETTEKPGAQCAFKYDVVPILSQSHTQHILWLTVDCFITSARRPSINISTSTTTAGVNNLMRWMCASVCMCCAATIEYSCETLNLRLAKDGAATTATSIHARRTRQQTTTTTSQIVRAKKGFSALSTRSTIYVPRAPRIYHANAQRWK